tara:strand:+ start:162 stop:521 length:360 start_codon:yes stop_codon:yes gene_type:complete
MGVIVFLETALEMSTANLTNQNHTPKISKPKQQSFEGFFTGDVYPPIPGAPSFLIPLILILIQFIQVFLMLTQRKWGARWFVPWVCLPHVYNYYRAVEVDLESGVPECVICMMELDPGK